MTQEAVSSEIPAKPAPEKEKPALLPDGVGLRLEQVQALLATQHNAAVPKDDPILMVVTICNAFLKEIHTLHQRHEAGLTKLMGDKTDAYVNGIKEATAQLAAGLSSASVQGFKTACKEHESRMAGFKSNLTWLAAIVAVSALVNVAVFVLLGWR